MELIDVTREPGPAVVALPESLSVESVAALRASLDAAFQSAAPVVVLTGADPHTFCTGLALDRAAAPAADSLATDAFVAVLEALLDAPRPTIAFVDGRAIGGGLGIAAACDWVVASQRATFALPELLWGLLPAMIWPIVVMRTGESAARRWTLQAHAQSAATAHAAGLVDDLAASGQERAALRRAVRMLPRAETRALRRFRQWMRECRTLPLHTAIADGAALTMRMAGEPATRGRLAAFAAGDAPWTT